MQQWQGTSTTTNNVPYSILGHLATKEVSKLLTCQLLHFDGFFNPKWPTAGSLVYEQTNTFALNLVHSDSASLKSPGIYDKLFQKCLEFLLCLFGSFPDHLIKLTTGRWSVGSSAPLFSQVCRDTVLNQKIQPQVNHWPKVLVGPTKSMSYTVLKYTVCYSHSWCS